MEKHLSIGESILKVCDQRRRISGRHLNNKKMIADYITPVVKQVFIFVCFSRGDDQERESKNKIEKEAISKVRLKPNRIGTD
jgi:rRNA pseudouridine-1189 N-methylase Emg1 (Nep1/Mra1 family)